MFQFRMNDLHKLTSRAHFPNEDHLAASSLAYGAGRGRTVKAIDSLRLHWAEYLMEAVELLCFLSVHSQPYHGIPLRPSGNSSSGPRPGGNYGIGDGHDSNCDRYVAVG
jgi:hypothetical protein